MSYLLYGIYSQTTMSANQSIIFDFMMYRKIQKIPFKILCSTESWFMHYSTILMHTSYIKYLVAKSSLGIYLTVLHQSTCT